MKSLKNILVVVPILLLQAGMPAAGQTPDSFSDTVRFELRSKKIIIPARINGQTADFILDTGGRNILSADTAQFFNMSILRREMVADVNSVANNLLSGSVDNLMIGDHYMQSGVPFMVMPPNNFFRTLGVAGILGSEAFGQAVVTFNLEERYIILNYPYRPRGVSREDGIKMVAGNHYQPMVPLLIGDRTFNILFDTGMAGLLHMSDEDMRSVRSGGMVDLIASGSGFMHVGIGGVDKVVPHPIEKVNVRELNIKDKKFTNIGVLTQPRSTSIIGLELLRYGNVMVDFPRGYFYFNPFTAAPEDVSAQTLNWNVKVLPVIDHFEITATVGDVDARNGERVWEINGISLVDMPLDENRLIELFGSIRENTSYILVGENKETTRKVTISKI